VNGPPIRVTVVIDHPAQHFTRALQLLSGEPGVQLRVCYWSAGQSVRDAGFARSISWDVDLLRGYEWQAPPPGRSLLGRTLSGRMHWLVRQLRAPRPQVLICYGWASPIARLSLLYCLLTRIPVMLYGDTTWQHSARGRHRVVRALALRVLMRASAGAVSTGAFNREFYISHGMDPRRIWPGVCPADTELFGMAHARGLTAQCGTAPAVGPAPLRIGFAGKLIARKGVDELLRGAALLPRARAWSVTVVGDGPLMPELQALAAELGLTDRVTFRGFANTTEMPTLLAAFDVVVVPSRLDMRVLVTIEAMAAGAAVIVSDATAVWGPGDLVEDGVSGLVYRSGDPAALGRQLSRLLQDPGLLAALRDHGARRVAGFGPEAFARTMASAIWMCVYGTGVCGTGVCGTDVCGTDVCRTDVCGTGAPRAKATTGP
jgi:glycosyltransferase involved in cell wall biosynthesis